MAFQGFAAENYPPLLPGQVVSRFWQKVKEEEEEEEKERICEK